MFLFSFSTAVMYCPSKRSEEVANGLHCMFIVHPTLTLESCSEPCLILVQSLWDYTDLFLESVFYPLCAVHLDASTSVEESQRLYEAKYSQLITKARNFFAQTESLASSSLVLISAGFDACTHEQPGMQRHGKSVPPQFYETFTKDAVQMANDWCAGKCVSILEGGYSDRALTSGVIAHLIGMGVSGIANDLYQPSNLYQLEKVAKMASSAQQRRRNHNDALAKDSNWLDYTLEALKRLEEVCGKKRIEATVAPVTPTRAMLDELWKSPRETRNGRGGGTFSAKVSPAK